MKKSHLMGVIALLISLNLLVFSCQNDKTTRSEVVEVPATTDSDKDKQGIVESDIAEDEATEEENLGAEEGTAMDEKAEDKESKVVAEAETKKKPAVANTPAAPPKPKKTKPKKPATPLAKFKFDKKEYNFGTVEVGTKVEHDFYFTNTGEVPMVITDANSTCGCTIPEIPKEPIAPGARGKVKVTFDSTGKIGMQDKHVTITANTYPKNTVIHMKGLALTENMMPTKKSATTASPSPYASPKLTEPTTTTPKKEEAKPEENSDSGTSLLPTSDKPAATSTDNKSESETKTDNKDQ